MNKRFLFCILGMILTLPAYADPVTVTSRDYVDTTVGARQNKIAAGTGDRVVTYSTTAGQIGSRAILDDLTGTTTTDTNLTTAEVAENAIYSKNQEVLNIGAPNVLTYSGNAGTLTSTPIYDSTLNTFSNGLVDAGTLNTAMTTAANDEMTCAEYATPGDATTECILWEINTSATAPLTTTAYLPANIAGTSYCYKSHDARYNGRNQCSTTMYNAFNAGEWGTVFPYGEVSGISVCSNIEPSIKYEYDWGNSYPYQVSTNQSGVQSQYDAWVSGGRPTTPVGGYCYCKLTNPSVAGARWVFRYSRSVSVCASYCAINCAFNVQAYADFRGAVFGGVAQ
ncbi:MAG: hypothetical protein J5620_03845 [Alphaproteobacteria bacterium]|nr:hypothetical protein [Alphaproteobacteria bacterium]